MTIRYPNIAAQLFNTPLLMHPQKLDAIIAGLGTRLLGTSGIELEPSQAEATLPADLFSTRRGQRADGGYRVVDGVAVIFASGALVHRSMIDANSSYLLGYNEMASKLEAAVDDPEVHAVLQIYDSPGGQVSGAFEYGDRIHALRGKKPMWAIADELAASAAYLAGSAFDKVAVASTGYVGSIGVVMRHVDFSRALANDGIKITHIFAGDHKVDANPYEPLARGVQDDLQAEVDALYTQFADAVVRNRGMQAEAVRATQARTYRGADAVAVGLADRVATTDQLISELAALRARSYPVGQQARSPGSPSAANPAKGATMSQTQPAADNPAASSTTTPQGGLTEEQAVAREAAAHSRGVTEGRAQELARANGCRAALLPGHEALVEKMAADGKTTPEQAAMAVLAAARQETTDDAARHRADAPKPVPSANAPDDSKAIKGAELGRSAVAAYRQFTGQKGA